MPAGGVGIPADVPIELGRDEARDLARNELADPIYDAEPPLLQQVVEWIIDRLQDLISRTAGALSGSIGLRILLAVVAVIVGIVVLRMGPLARRGTRTEPLFPAGRRTAAEYRAAADTAAARRDWPTAVIERYRAVVVAFEERGLLDPRPGRTADEAATEGGAVLPGLAADLLTASRLFDGIRYGGYDATADDDERLRRLDAEALAARPERASAEADLPMLAVPR
jgi:Domain of unknown function (DUF4129)